MTARSFAFDGFRGEAAAALAVADPAAEARRLLDPASALETLHWGRNYLYRAEVETADGPLDVVVKQFRETSLRDRLRRRRRAPSKARRSWQTARALAAAGFATPEPLLLVEPERPGSPALYVCRHLAGRIELRYLLRARNAGSEAVDRPGLDVPALIAAVALLARRLHDAGFWHRDFSVGNLLVELRSAAPGFGEIALLDLNRCRSGRPVSTSERMRDLCRLPLERAEDRAVLLASYFGGTPPPLARRLYELDRRSFHGRHRLKPKLRAAWARLRSWLVPRGVHAHIPPPPAGAPARDKIVWDRLSDQPHSHAGRLERAAVRLADLPVHLRSSAALAGAVPRIRRGYRRLVAERNARPFAWPGAGVALRPASADGSDLGELLAAFDALGVRQALVRLHPWQDEHRAEEALARALAERGVELTFALPQNRELVRDEARWRAAVAGLAERFRPFGRRFQVGQAINRSKWGVWNHAEYLELAAAAATILRAGGEVELAGPAVIDFEAHVTAAVVNLRHPDLRFDALASLLYVDRRGAPENRQLGFDTVDKVTLLAAIAESSRLVGHRRQWITEVNWPLAEGPHSPAGRSVAVNEREQADYLERFYLLALGSGYVERVFWWQLAARGYGLADPRQEGELRRRPAFAALAMLERELAGALCLGPRPAPAPIRRYAFRRADGGTTEVVWSVAGRAELPSGPAPAALATRDGEQPPDGPIALDATPRYLRYAGATEEP